ncbi:HVO_A0556 family zinc finger protein [Natrinema saccharevitans]|uniref:HVO_A0556 family zinc finger protein n=1 Tax=Natrinema saccharevitans TaxID=301967 RepID=UPI00158AC2A1|nr:HVO_A0556 family zinc finger protein [Natrinema saccharevitans]
MQLTNDETGTYPVLEALEGERCSFCDRGRLVRGSYKGNAAVICDTCETPGAQLW